MFVFFLLFAVKSYSLQKISVAIATYEREQALTVAIAQACQSDYPNFEVLVADDSASCVAMRFAAGNTTFAPCDVSIYCVPRMTLGAKRNKLAELARGSIVAMWDDDDFFRADRLSSQSALIRAGLADIVAFEAKYFYDMTISPARFLIAKATGERQHAHYGPLMFRRDFFTSNQIRFPETYGDDVYFVFIDRAKAANATIQIVENNGEFVYVVHRTQQLQQLPAVVEVDPPPWYVGFSRSIVAEFGKHQRKLTDKPFAHSRKRLDGEVVFFA